MFRDYGPWREPECGVANGTATIAANSSRPCARMAPPTLSNAMPMAGANTAPTAVARPTRPFLIPTGALISATGRIVGGAVEGDGGIASATEAHHGERANDGVVDPD